MKKFTTIATSLFLSLAFIATLSPSTAYASTHVRGYTTKTGRYVAPYYRSSSNHTKSDNWSTKGNYNPYTGKIGTKKIW